MKKPKVSVIIPLFKTEAFVERCVRSVMTQTFTDIEILCVDDQSPDGSAGIVERLAQEDSRITLIRHPVNLGLGGARNTGIKAARADYIASVDSDDHVEPNFLADLWAGSEDGYYDVVVSGYRSVTPDGKQINRITGKNKILDPIPEGQNPIKISDPAFWNKLWRRSLFIDNNIFFPNHIYHQDSATTPRVYTKAKNVRFIKSWKYNYLIRNDSITQSVSDKHLLDRYRCVDVLKNFFINEGLYGQLEEALKERTYSGYSYHVGNVIRNKHGGEAGTDDYLRHLLIMRDAYLEYDMTVRSMSLEEKADLLLNHKPIPRNTSSASPSPVSQLTKQYTSRPPLPENPRILVLTLYSGEHEFEQGSASLSAQTHSNWRRKVFRGMGNLEAHQALYRYVMDSRGEFDLFMKVDADMVFAHPEVMVDIIQNFRERPTLDHFVVGCEDYMTGETIIGVHTFSNRVTWETNGSGIFNDPDPVRPGTRKIIEAPKKPFFQHAPDPSSLQAFHFGAHRALKLVQRGYTVEQKRTQAMNTQWKALNGVWRQFLQHEDRRHALALVAADLVISGSLGDNAHDYHSGELQAAYDDITTYSSRALFERVQRNWRSEDARKEYFRRAIGSVGLDKLAKAS